MGNRFWRCLFFLVFVLAATVVEGRVWSAEDVPMVHLQDRTKYVCDPESLLSQAMRDSADIYLHRLHAECGVQSVFVVVPQVKNADCFRMAQDIGNNYGVGTSKDRRGLVIVIAVGDRRYFIAPGKGLEGDLTDIECNDIARACIVANMRLNNTDGAVLSTSKAIYSKLKTGKTGVEQIDSAEEYSVSDWLLAVFFLLIFFGPAIVGLIRYLLEMFGLVEKRPVGRRDRRNRRNDDDDWIPPFIFGGSGGFGRSGGGFGGGSFGGGSFGGGGAGGGW